MIDNLWFSLKYMAIYNHEKKLGHSANTCAAFTCVSAMYSMLKEAESFWDAHRKVSVIFYVFTNLSIQTVYGFLCF